KTPPARPTSSPMTSTDSSRASSQWKASLIASTMSSSAMPALPQVRRRLHVRVVEEELRVGIGLRFRGRDAGAHELQRFLADRGLEIVVQDPVPAQVPLVTAEALVLLLLLDAVEIDVDARVVGGRVRRGAI